MEADEELAVSEKRSRIAVAASSPPSEKTSPWAKLISCRMP
jgi:hypothetical protein